ncbi:MAG: restriction endonuclease subunit S [Reyranella sp.]|nr:restriction endonuclease subunit S [Reyranella sp.]
MSMPRPLVKLGDVLTRVARGEVVDPSKEYRLLGIRLDGQGPFLREVVMGTQTSATKLFRVAKGDFIYSRLFACRGAFGVIGEELDGCYVSGEFPTFLPVPDKIDVEFLKYWFRLPRVIARVDQDCTGSTPLTRNRFKENFFVALEIPLPSLEEQHRIVERTGQIAVQIHEARILRRQATEEADALPLAELRAIFERETKRHGLARLETLLVAAGYGSSEKCDSERMEGATPVLRIPNVAAERITFSNLKYARLNRYGIERLLLSEGDVLVVRTNGSLSLVGRSAVVPKLTEDFAFASYMIRLQFDHSRIVPAYAQRMLQHLRMAGVLIDFARTTAGQYNVSLGRLRAAEIPVPPLDEQRQIVTELDALQSKVDTLKDVQAETAVEIGAMMPSILNKAFSGSL